MPGKEGVDVPEECHDIKAKHKLDSLKPLKGDSAIAHVLDRMW